MILDDKKIQKILVFSESAHDAVRDCRQACFTCPVCGGQALAVKSLNDGHIRAKCNKCKMNFME